MPGLSTQPAAQGVPRGTDRRADARRDAPAGRGQRLVNRVQTGRGRDRDQPGGGVVIDFPGQLTQVEHHSAVRRGRPHIGVPAAARSHLEVIGSSNAIAFCTSAADVTVTTAAGVEPLWLVLKTCLAVPNCAPPSGRNTCPSIAAERPSQPELFGSAVARTEPKTAPAANAPAAPRRNVCVGSHAPTSGSRDCVMSRNVNHGTTKTAVPHDVSRDGDAERLQERRLY